MKIEIEPQLMANWESPRWEFPQSNLLLHTRSTNQESILTSSLYQLHFSPSAWKSHFCVTQLKLYTLYELSGSIFCCLSVCEASVSPNQISTFLSQYIWPRFLLRFTIPLSTKYLPYPGLPFLAHYHSPLKTNQFLVQNSECTRGHVLAIWYCFTLNIRM